MSGIFTLVISLTPAAVAVPDGEQAVADAMSRSSCHTLGIANWILPEYPLWPALHQDRWPGQIVDVDVTNASSKLENPAIRPCALVRQVTASYVSADAGMATLPFAGGFVLSVDAEMVGGISQVAPGFASRSGGVKVLPGRGWVMTASSPTMTSQADVYLTSSSARRVTLHFNGLADALLISRAGSQGSPLAGVSRGGSFDVALTLRPGLTDLHLKSGSGRNLVMSGIQVVQ